MLIITKRAKNYLINHLKDTENVGVCVQIVKGGCLGMQYKFSHIKNSDDLKDVVYEEIPIDKQFKLFVVQEALLFVIGTVLEHEKTNTGEKLVFKNPNEKSRCACGKSFNFR